MDAPDKNPSLLAGQTAHPTTQSAVASAAAPELIGLVTHEDVDRARDRWEVARARSKGGAKKFGGVRLLWLLVAREFSSSSARTMPPVCCPTPRTARATVSVSSYPSSCS